MDSPFDLLSKGEEVLYISSFKMNSIYDYLIVGSGLFGSTFAHFARKQGKRCLVIDKRSHLGGNLYWKEFMCINMGHIYFIPIQNVFGTL